MSGVGLVLGGGGITGAAFHFGALLSIEAATGWDPNDAEIVIGTSSGAFVSALVRSGRLDMEAFVADVDDPDELTEHWRHYVYRTCRPRGVGRWLRRGVIPGLRRPDLTLSLGSPARYSTTGMGEWVEDMLGDAAHSWPAQPLVIVAYDLEQRRRAPFGTDAAPDVALKDAVAASIAVPVIFEPVKIDDRWYVDGGVSSGTSADLLLAHPEPLDLVIVLAPLAASESRRHARFYEDAFDRVGRLALEAELALIRDTWPQTDVLVLRPDERVLEAARPNPMAVDALVPVFLRTLRSLNEELAHPETWRLLHRHLAPDHAPERAGSTDLA